MKSSSVVLLVVLLANAVPASAVDQAAVERVRAMLLDRVKTAPAPDDIKREYVTLIEDDSQPLDDATVAAVFEDADRSAHQVARRQAYIIVCLFRYREDPQRISALMDKIALPERDLVFGMLSVFFPEWVTPAYLPVAEKGLLGCIDQAQSLANDRIAQGRQAEMARNWLRLAARTKSPNAGPAILQILQTRVVDPDLRFNLVAAATDYLGPRAEALAKWYFERYCFRPFEVQVLGSYFVRHLHEVEANALISNKAALLSDAARKLATGDLNSVTTASASQPSTAPATVPSP